jgi:hypothetical protein
MTELQPVNQGTMAWSAGDHLCLVRQLGALDAPLPNANHAHPWFEISANLRQRYPERQAVFTADLCREKYGELVAEA